MKDNKNKTQTRRNPLLWVFVLLLFAIPLGTLKAQDTSTDPNEELDTIIPFSQSMKNYILPLDKSFITTGLLADMAFPYVSLTSFDGQTDTLVTFRQWKQMHRQMYLSQVSDTNALIVPEKLKQMTREFKNRGIIPIALMNLKYNRFKPYAIDSNLIVFSEGKFYDVPGRTESPYFEERLFAATVYQDKVYSGRVTFRIDDHFFLCNTMESVSMVEIDFADGRGYRSYSMSNLLNNDVTVSYRHAGTKVITFRMTLTDQTVLQTKTRITLVLPPRVEPDETLEITGQAYDGVEGKGKAYILYGCGNDSTLRKPIIVSDGFDPDNSRHFPELYEMLDGKDENGQSLKFIEKARAEGFDFVILDYDEGADYIQRNAFVMVSLIEEVNSRLKDYHPRLTIIGPSMGGLITRYALNYMEQQRKNHNTGLYVSFDSPHLGANIPLGDQHWLEFFATNTGNEEAVENRDKLNTLAAKQMLIYHHTQTNNNQANHHPLRTSFLADPYFNSWPTKCRKIAIANGSGEGTKLFEAHTQMIEYEYSPYWLFQGVVKGNTWAVPNNNDGKEVIFEGKYPDKFIFNTIPSHYIKSKIKVKETQPYDGAPGGTYDVNKMIADADTDDHGDIETDYPDICFIPVISSLALNTNDVNYRVHGIPGYPYPSSNNTPFDAIYAPDDNEEHVTVTDDNIGWIMNEIGAFDLYLQNQTINKATDFEARNSITTGRNVVSHIPTGDFVVQNSVGEVDLHSEGIIRLKEGTHLKPEREGVVRLWVSEFQCTSQFAMRDHPLRGNTIEETGIEERDAIADSESAAQSVAEKLPRNHPNPCRGITTIEYELDGNARVEIEVYSLMGVKLMTIEERHGVGAGRYSTTLNTSSLPAGMYIVVVKANGVTNGVLKMQVVK